MSYVSRHHIERCLVLNRQRGVASHVTFNTSEFKARTPPPREGVVSRINSKINPSWNLHGARMLKTRSLRWTQLRLEPSSALSFLPTVFSCSAPPNPPPPTSFEPVPPTSLSFTPASTRQRSQLIKSVKFHLGPRWHRPNC